MSDSFEGWNLPERDHRRARHRDNGECRLIGLRGWTGSGHEHGEDRQDSKLPPTHTPGW